VVELRGITWDHPRGLSPMRATAEQFEAAHPDVHIVWDARSLAAFGEQPLEQLVKTYDLLVIDHPFVGKAAESKSLLLPLDTCLAPDLLAEQAAQSVGPSFRSYTYAGHQWALAIDAAAHVSAYRRDLLAEIGQPLPETWEQVFDLAMKAPIALPLNAAGTIDSFLSLCANCGEPPGQSQQYLVGRETARHALAMLRRLASESHAKSLMWSPPQVLDCLATTNEVVYCPLLFGYATYARPGFAPHLVHFTNIPASGVGQGPQGALLGGTGLAISAYCRAVPEAAAYAAWVASAECQRTLYAASGGQPANRVAWTNLVVNNAASNFYLDTLQTLEGAYVRPRYSGFVELHDRLGVLLHDYLRAGGDIAQVLDEMERLYLSNTPKSAS